MMGYYLYVLFPAILLFRQELQNTLHDAVAGFLIADALQWESHSEGAVAGTPVGNCCTGSRKITHGAEGCAAYWLEYLRMGGCIMLGIQRIIVAELLAQSAYHRRCSYDAVSLKIGRAHV